MPTTRGPHLLRRVDRASLPKSATPLPSVVANRWHGQVDCAVGPFSSRAAAAHFAYRVVDFGLFDAFSGRIFTHRDGWFVEVRPDTTG